MGDNELYRKISPVANEYKHFLALFVGVYYMVVFRSNSLCKMGDNELYSKISPFANACQRFLALFVRVLSGRIFKE